ncbi:MAG: carbohydrate kinase family protein [Patescibacteria group bacterium]
MLHNLDVVCVGSAKIDIFLSLHEANKHLRLIPKTNELCLKYGEKITVDKADLLLGGNAANVAVGLSRLGLKTSMLAEIGMDEFSEKITKTLQSENVDISRIQKTKGEPSSFSTIINFKGERTILSEHLKRKHDFNFDNISTKWVYLTSLGEEWKNAYATTAEFVRSSKSHLAFNPGTMQIDKGYKHLSNILALSDILFLNKEEATRISSANSADPISNKKDDKKIIKLLLTKLQNLGPKIVVITDGKNGSYAIREKGEIFKEDIAEANVVEKTGAGDAYSTGFLAAILHGLSIKDAMHWGTLNSGSVIGKVGAQKGLLTKEEMEKK